MKTVLFAWELGRGLGHLMNIRRIAVRLKPHGIRIVAATSGEASVDILRHVADEVIEAPPWPLDLQPGSPRPAASTATLNDVLSDAGLADGAAVHRLLAAWDDVLTAEQPDLVVADFSPMAALAARGRIPRLLIGNGYTLPPHEMARFPKLHRHSPPVFDEARTLETVNGAIRKLGREPLDRLPQLFQGDAGLVQTFPLLDPYDTQRPDFACGPLCDDAPEERNADGDTIFAYLSGGYVPHPSIFDALKPFGARLRIHAPGLPAAQQQALRERGARVDAGPPRLAAVLPSARLVVHHGGTGVAAEALAAGVPQVVLSAQIEQDLNGEALSRAGVARFVRTYVAGASIDPELIRSAAEDTALADRAAAQGHWHRQYLESHDAMRTCETTCLRLLRL